MGKLTSVDGPPSQNAYCGARNARTATIGCGSVPDTVLFQNSFLQRLGAVLRIFQSFQVLPRIINDLRSRLPLRVECRIKREHRLEVILFPFRIDAVKQESLRRAERIHHDSLPACQVGLAKFVESTRPHSCGVG